MIRIQIRVLQWRAGGECCLLSVLAPVHLSFYLLLASACRAFRLSCLLACCRSRTETLSTAIRSKVKGVAIERTKAKRDRLLSRDHRPIWLDVSFQHRTRECHHRADRHSARHLLASFISFIAFVPLVRASSSFRTGAHGK